jgi:hypothetical protein
VPVVDARVVEPRVVEPTVVEAPVVEPTVVTPVETAVTPAVVVTGHRRARAGEQADLAGRGRGGDAQRGCSARRREVLFGVGGCGHDQGAGCCDGHQASGGVQLFSHVVSLSPEFGTRPSNNGTLVDLYGFQYPDVSPWPNNAQVRS